MTTIDVLEEMRQKEQGMIDEFFRDKPNDPLALIFQAEIAALTDAIRSLEAVRAWAVNPGMTELRDKNDLTPYGVGHLDAMRHVLSILDESEAQP